MWGTCNGSGLALTPLDKALTRFEPIQRVNPEPFDLWRLQADSRLGPLDLPVTETPTFTGPVPPRGSSMHECSRCCRRASRSPAIKSKGGKVTGAAKLTRAGSSTGIGEVTVTDPGYAVMTESVKL